MSVQYWQRLTQQNNVLRWGIFPGKYFYIADFFEAAYKIFPERSTFHWPQSLGLFVDEEMLILVELDKLQAVGKKVFDYYLLNQKRKKTLLASCNQQYVTLQKFLSKFPNLMPYAREDLVQFGLELHQQIIEFWLVTLPIELANYGGWALLESIAKTKNWSCSLIDLIALELPTFYQKEELALVKTKNIQAHQHKYFWLKNSYHHTEILPVEFFMNRKRTLKPGLLKKQREHFKQVKAKKVACIHQYNLSTNEIELVHNLSLGLWLQEERKQYILQIQHYKEIFLRAVQKFLPDFRKDVYQYSLKEIIACLQGTTFPKRSKTLGVVCKNNKVKLRPASETHAYWQMKIAAQKLNYLQGRTLIRGNKRSISGYVSFFDTESPQPNAEDVIVIVKSISSEHVSLLRNVQAIILESYQVVTHTLLAALAHTYLGKMPTIVVIPHVSRMMKPLDRVILTIHNNRAVLSSVTILKGTVACAPGHMAKIRGKVLLVKSGTPPIDIANTIIVLPCLSIDTIFAYRHSRCIITDSGGITSHGAIMCRELQIPCIVGVGNATKVLINGQKIIVNLKTGELDVVGGIAEVEV